MVRLENIHKSYRVNSENITVLENVSLCIRPGEIMGLIGKSGAGKSTLLRCVNLLERPTQGHVFLQDLCLTELGQNALREARRSIGMVFQEPTLLETATVFENIALPLRFTKHSPDAIKKAVEVLLARVGLVDYVHAYPASLSGGQRQRVGIARALVNRPTVLLCDEITSALDPETTMAILRLVKELTIDLQLSVLWITHEMAVLKQVADRVGVLEGGHIVEEQSTVDLFKSPKTAISRAFVLPDYREHIRHFLAVNGETSGQESPIFLRLAFSGALAAQPIISELAKTYSVDMSILQANLEFLGAERVGCMLVHLRGPREERAKAIACLQAAELVVEVLSHER